MINTLCTICYDDELGIVTNDEIIYKCAIGGNEYLPMWMICFYQNVTVPMIGGHENHIKHKYQGVRESTKILNDLVDLGIRKP